MIPETKILVLKDVDMNSGKPVNEEIREQYLAKYPENHRVLRRFEIENYLYDKEVLKKYCDINRKPFDQNAYDLNITDIVHQQVKDFTGDIKKICGITENLSKEDFKKRLSECIDEKMKVYQELENLIFGPN